MGLTLKKQYDPTDLERFQRERTAAAGTIAAQLAGVLSPDLAAEVANREAARQVAPAKVAGVQVVAVGDPGDRQHFTPGLIEQGTAEGWLSMRRGVLEIHHQGEDGEETIGFRVVRSPGHYCCHCGMPIEDAAAWVDAEQTMSKGMAHVATAHAGLASPDPENPAGYERINYFHCERLVGSPAAEG